MYFTIYMILCCLYIGGVCNATYVQGAAMQNEYRTVDGWIYTYEGWEVENSYITVTGYERERMEDTELVIPVMIYDSDANIDEYVTAIGDSVFEEDEDITGIDIPASISSIGEGAFRNCKNLRTVTVGDGMTVDEYGTGIGEGAFYNCTLLENVELPDGIENIDSQAFAECGNMKKITLPLGLTYIGESAFYNCHSLKEMHIPGGVTEIGRQAFAGCRSLDVLDIMNNDLESIGELAFYGCENLVGIRLPDNITDIGAYAFKDCRNLQSISIPDGVTTLGKPTENVFEGCRKLVIYTTAGSLAHQRAMDWGGKVELMDVQESESGYQIHLGFGRNQKRGKIIHITRESGEYRIFNKKSSKFHSIRVRAYQKCMDEMGIKYKLYGHWENIEENERYYMTF